MYLNRWKLSFFISICVICLISCQSTSAPDSQNISNTTQGISQTSSKDKYQEYKEYEKTKFPEYKEKGIQAIKEDRLTDGIEFILKAIAIQDEPELRKILDNAYLERAEYFCLVGEKEKTRSDLEKIKSKENIDTALFYRLVADITDLKTIFPENEQMIEDTNFSFKWYKVPECDYYQIQVEDSNWNTVVLETTESDNFKASHRLKDMSIYYWHVRAHYPNDTWGNWSKKIWFATQTPEGLAKKELDRIKNLITIKSFYTCTPNFVGGVDFHLIWTNKSTKTIKYANFQVVPYNAVGDIVSCTIKNRPEAYLSVTGPVKPGETEGYGTYWSALWYNPTIVKAKIIEVRIEYMDGSEDIIPEEYIQDIIQ